MAKGKRYLLNPETLLVEIREVSSRPKFFRRLSILLCALALAALYIWFFSVRLGYDLPKTALLRRQNAAWVSRLEVLNRRMDRVEETLQDLRLRDDGIYRSVFGMDPVPASVREAPLEGAERYESLARSGASPFLERTVRRMDALLKQADVQSRSLDEVGALSRRAGDMASSIPAILPMEPGSFRASSPFGYRSDPLTGVQKRHTGFDMACKPGNPIYTTGDGVVAKVAFELNGYGHQVIVDHGFGYRTRYAHMGMIYVVEGMKLHRGDCIGESGNSGRTSGPHLHYEVLYRGDFVNPANYMDMEMGVEEYRRMVRHSADRSGRAVIPARGRFGR